MAERSPDCADNLPRPRVPSIATEFVFEGRLASESFVTFARHRATRLDLDFEIGETSEKAVAVSIRGQEALVDAFEMACSLGPYDCLIIDVRRRDFAMPDLLP